MARETLESGLIKIPDSFALSLRLAFVLCIIGRATEALDQLNRLLLLYPESAEVYDLRGLACMRLGNIELAISSLRKALDLDQRCVSAYVNMGSALRLKGCLKDALKWFYDAINLDENNKEAYNNIGITYLGMNDLEGAEESLNTALRIDPDFAEAHFNLGRVLLMAEKFSEGWQHSEWRWLCSDFPSRKREFVQKTWDGENLKGKIILVWGEQGIGDEIMFASTLPELIKQSKNVIIECNERLVSIYNRSFKAATVVARKNPPDRTLEDCNADVEIALGSISKHYRRTLDSFPSRSNGYLKPDPILTAELKSKYTNLGTGLRVGISWRSGNLILGHERSIPIAFWRELLSTPNCHFINLQYGDIEKDLRVASEEFGINIYRDESIDPLRSAEDWFAQIAALDHVISIDNSTIQVSGSLGIPTWALISSAPEWRFGLSRSDHLWHSSLRIFRQQNTNGWAPLMSEVSRNFAEFVNDKI